jgi:hypothetical protein
VAANSVTVSVSEAGVGVITIEDCSSNTDTAGQCTVTVNSSVEGSSTVNASATVNVGGVDIYVATDGYGAHIVSNVKTWVDGSLRWVKHDNLGQLLPGAEFEVCRTHTLLEGVMTEELPAPVCFPVTDDSDGVDGPLAPLTDQDGTGGEFLLVDLILGRYTVRETLAPPGYTIVNPNPVTAPDMSVAAPDVEIATPFVNNPPLEGCTPGYWKNNRTSLWDNIGDSLVTKMPAGLEFITTTDFQAYFGLSDADMAAAGIPLGTTMEGAINLGGGEGKKLARHGVTGLLNFADGINYGVDGIDSFTDLYNALGNAYLTYVYEPLATQIATANNRDHDSCGVGETSVD